MPVTLHTHFASILDDIRARIPAPHLAVAVSGGADSMALLLLAQAYAVPITALTVDHGLREGSAAEAQQVAEWCRARGLAHHILTPAPLPIPNLQTRAREMRYGALGNWCRANDVGLLLVAHHFDDQAETVALQRHRGDSPPSRSGMALVSRRGGLHIARPLLGVRKATLLAYLQSQSQHWVEDPSNQSEAYARNRLRGTLSEQEITALWGEAQQQGAQRHADDVAQLDWIVAHVSAADDGLVFETAAWRALPDAARTDVLSRAIRAVGGKRFRPRHHETTRLDERLRSVPSGKATLGHCLVTWNKQIHMAREHALELPLEPPHMPLENPLKQLASEPFWWFNYSPFPI